MSSGKEKKKYKREWPHTRERGEGRKRGGGGVDGGGGKFGWLVVGRSDTRQEKRQSGDKRIFWAGTALGLGAGRNERAKNGNGK